MVIWSRATAARPSSWIQKLYRMVLQSFGKNIDVHQFDRFGHSHTSFFCWDLVKSWQRALTKYYRIFIQYALLPKFKNTVLFGRSLLRQKETCNSIKRFNATTYIIIKYLGFFFKNVTHRHGADVEKYWQTKIAIRCRSDGLSYFIRSIRMKRHWSLDRIWGELVSNWPFISPSELARLERKNNISIYRILRKLTSEKGGLSSEALSCSV